MNVRQFIQDNYTPYYGDEKFLAPPTIRTLHLWEQCLELLEQERQQGVIGIETDIFSGINEFAPGYIDKNNEVIVGLQTDKPLKRIVNPYGGVRMAKKATESYGYSINEQKLKDFQKYRKSHNEGVFDAYSKDIKLARHNHLLTGLPDAYGRGRIIGDYRLVALYGIDEIVKEKQQTFALLSQCEMSANIIQELEEISMQIKALKEMATMAQGYGIDISKPATSAQAAVQAVYMAYLAGAKENNGAATSLGRVSTFLDIYIEKDIQEGKLTEEAAQELIDQFIIKLRLIRHLRTPEYNELFAGDPTWITESIGGMGLDGRTLVTKTSYRFLNTLTTLGSAPEPNLTVLWSAHLPEPFKKYCAKMSIETDSIQYENDDLMRPIYGDDYGIACCVSAMQIGKQMQFFGARCNIAKALLYAINGGIDEITGELVVPDIAPITTEYLDYETVWSNYLKVLNYTAKIYVQANNIIHYMHDKYAYESSQMALHVTLPERLMAFGVAGLSVATDSLSAIKYAKVKPIREDGIAKSFIIEGEFPKFGNDIDEVDDIAVEITKSFQNNLKKHKLYRNAKHTLSILTITSNVVYGKNTGATPDGRPATAPFAPGANPMHGRDESGALASLNSVAKIPYVDNCEDGVSNTFSIVPTALGTSLEMQQKNLVSILDGYFAKGAQHLNVNVLNREMLMDAYNYPEKYPLLTIRVSGYAVNFCKLTKEQQREVISRTFHEGI
jgi:formate C-acetyltransferase